MFIRWKRRKQRKTETITETEEYYGYTHTIERTIKSRHQQNNGADYLTAALVENKREGDKVKQRYIKYLGSISENSLSSTFDKLYFWDTIDKNLSELNLSKEELDNIHSTISKKVNRPTQSEIEEAEARIAELRSSLKEQMGYRV